MSSNFEITRSEATKVVEMYMKCTNDPLTQKGRKCKYTAPMKTFRDMTSDKHMGAFLVGKGPYDKHSENSDMFFNVIKELVESVAKEKFVITQKRIRTTLMSELETFKSLKITMFLKSAIDNYFQQTHKYIKEALSDNTYEYNDCSVCKWAGNDYFYYSTIYGLNVPVCSVCVEKKEKEEFENYSECSDSCCDGNNEEEEGKEIDEYAGYVFVYKEDETEPQVCSVCDYNGCGSFYYSSDKIDEPVCHNCEMKYRETADCSKRIYHDGKNTKSCEKCNFNGAGFFATEDNKVFVCWDCREEKVSDDDYIDDNDIDIDIDSEYVPSDEEEEDNEEDFSDDPDCQENDEDNNDNDPEKFFGCEGCQYEWRDGWQKGWKAAMKQIKKFAKQQKRPENIQIPECAYCGASHNLKKCAGTCEGAVRYCSLVCQKKDWKEGHKQECGAKQ